jgi:hypothetical protein
MDKEKMVRRIVARYQEARLQEARFEKGVPADPTINMSEEDVEMWWEMNDKFKDKLKKAKYWKDKI